MPFGGLFGAHRTPANSVPYRVERARLQDTAVKWGLSGLPIQQFCQIDCEEEQFAAAACTSLLT